MNDHSVRKCIALSTGILGQFQSSGVFAMRPVLWGLLVFVLCLPLTFVLHLAAAARYPAMDGLTARLPPIVGAAVSQIALRKAPGGKDGSKALDRVIRLDPENAEAWSWRCHANDNATAADEPACRKAIALGPTAWNFNGLGDVQEHAGDFCAAEDSYTRAVQVTTNEALYLRNMARAAIRCGHTGASVAGFEVAEGLDAKAAADPDEDELTKDDLRKDREYLTVAYDRAKQPDKATAMCTKAHPEWKTCHCELTDSSVKCGNAEGVSSQSKK
jgi:tetratricopeptide (TPR) repeat protein